MDIYYSSVGRNGVLLLNIPPDKKGKINDSDVNALTGFRKQLDETFENNLLKSATLKGSTVKKTNLLFDGKDSSYWKTAKADGNLVMEFKLDKAQKFNLLLLQENLQIGQRVEQFVLEYKEGTTWKKVTEGTTIGYKRLLRFPSVTARELRLRILSSRLQPAIAEIGLYLRPVGDSK